MGWKAISKIGLSVGSLVVIAAIVTEVLGDSDLRTTLLMSLFLAIVGMMDIKGEGGASALYLHDLCLRVALMGLFTVMIVLAETGDDSIFRIGLWACLLLWMLTLFKQVNDRIDQMQTENQRQHDAMREVLRVFEGRVTRLEEEAGMGPENVE